MFIDQFGCESNHTRVAYFNLPNNNWYYESEAHEGHPAWGTGEGLFALEDGVWSPVNLRSYTSVGTYPLGYLLGHRPKEQGCDIVLCPDCAEECYKGEGRPDVFPVINWNDPSLYCYECGVRIESAYAEDSA